MFENGVPRFLSLVTYKCQYMNESMRAIKQLMPIDANDFFLHNFWEVEI